MAISVDKMRLPVNKYELLDGLDDRFSKVKLWVAHTGENVNHSIFEKETLEKMAASLPMTPIVGYVEKNTEDNDDFSDHRESIKLQNGGIKIDYLCHAYGFIPEENHFDFEFKDGKEWLTVEGFLWNKFNTAIDIFKDSGNKKSQSMEIDNVEGSVNEDGNIVVSDARFSALCILGDHVSPGMAGSKIQLFSENTLKEEMKQMFMEFSRKGEYKLEELEKNEQIEVPVDAEFKEEGKDDTEPETKVEEEFEPDKEEEFVKDDEGESEDDTDASEPEDSQDDEDKKEKFELTYSLSHEDIRTKIYQKLRDLSEEWVYIIKTFDDHIICEQEIYDNGSYTSKFMQVNYALENEEVKIGEVKEVFATFLDASELADVESKRNKLSELENQIAELTAEKESFEVKEKEEILNKFSSQLTEEEVATVKESFGKFSKNDIEKEIAFLIFKKKDFSVEDRVVAANLNKNETNGKYGELDRFFN